MKENITEKDSPLSDPKLTKSSQDPIQKVEGGSEISSKARRNKKRQKNANSQPEITEKNDSAVKSEINHAKPVEKKTTEKAPKTKKNKKDTESMDVESVTPPKMNGNVTMETSNTKAEKNDTEKSTTAASKKKTRNKRKKKSANKEEPAKEKEETADDKDYTIDYQSLREVLELQDKENTIYFAPLTNGKSKFHETAVPTFSYSTPQSSEPGRVSNKFNPSAKNRHAEVPPPPSLNVKSKAAKSAMGEKSTINKIKGSRTKAAKNKEPVVDKKDIESTDATAINHDDKAKHSSKKSLGSPVKPVVITKEEKKISVKKTTEASKGERKRGQKESKKGLKEAVQEEYCHPNDVIHNSKNRRPRYERYLDPEVYEAKLKEKDKFYKGTLRINKRNRFDAYVTCDDLEFDIFIYGQRDRNRAFDGDTVVVELIDLDAVWNKKKDALKEKREENQQPPSDEDEDKNKPKYAGKVVAIPIPNVITTCAGILGLSRHGFGQSQQESEAVDDTTDAVETNKDVRLVWFKPNDLRKPIVAIQLKHAPADILKNEEKYKNLLMVVDITRWPIDSSNPFGKVVRELGHIGNIPAETQAVLEDNGIIEQPFSKKALKGLPQTPWSIDQSEIDKRRDLRETRIFTIDPSTAKDLDDAVHVVKLGDNDYEVGVHIADVSHFVHRHTALDHEAFDRGTSTYLCDRVIPMLPSLLCEQLCSLNPNVERLSFSVIWKMDSEGNIKDTWFGKSIIKSCAKLAYEDAQSVIEGNGLPKTATVSTYSVSEVEQDIEYLYKISKHMRKRRFDSGALSINSIRLSFQLNELGEPCGVSIYEQKDSNRLIEEFMLCANMSVAQKIYSHFPNEALLRHHSPPHDKTLNEFIRIAENLGYAFDGSSAGSLQRSFEAIESEDVKSVLRLLAVKPMQRAKYFCTGSYNIAKYRHYALNVPLYTHFTSPIRRFPDIIVHRQLEAALENKKSCGYKKDAVEKAAGHCNQRKEGAKNSQDSNIQLYLYHYLHMLESQSQKPVVRTAIVTQVLKDCFEVLVPEYGIEKRIHMDALPINKFVHDGLKSQLSVFWKEGVEANRRYDEKRKTDENYVKPLSTIENDGGMVDDNDDALKSIIISKELSSNPVIDSESKSQQFTTFSKLNVRIQVNVERSPPIVFVYPVNPFM